MLSLTHFTFFCWKKLSFLQINKVNVFSKLFYKDASDFITFLSSLLTIAHLRSLLSNAVKFQSLPPICSNALPPDMQIASSQVFFLPREGLSGPSYVTQKVPLPKFSSKMLFVLSPEMTSLLSHLPHVRLSEKSSFICIRILCRGNSLSLLSNLQLIAFKISQAASVFKHSIRSLSYVSPH